MHKLFRFAMLVSAASFPTAMVAQPNPATGSVAVSYADLDLGSPAGRRVLDTRVSAAVRELCGPSVLLSLNATVQRRRCVREAFASARPQIQLAVARRGAGTQIALNW